MIRIKRIDTFILQSFLPLFVMTFCICLFIVLMQFLWRYIDDMVGKGLGIDVLGELFFYAAMTMVPMALPLAILLASLMIFGNLGENFELTAMKASGISLIRTMAPLIILMVFIAVGAFFFQNNMLPIAQTKMWTLLYSVRQKSPELEIPEGVFYDQIPGYNLFVESKNRDSGMLYDMMIYDVSRGFENSSIILADSGKMAITPDKTRLFLQLWDGESFENLKDVATGMKNVPYRRESFSTKEILVKFDANFNRMDEEGIRSQYVGKNMAELQATIDSVGAITDSMAMVYGKNLRTQRILSTEPYIAVRPSPDSEPVMQLHPDVEVKRHINIDSVFRGASSGTELRNLNQALTKAERARSEYEFRALQMADQLKTVRRHAIELQKKFTLSFACIIFFFIGAPLGAIIRKGGLGTPLVISVILFIFYYIIDNMGYKMARDGKLPVWQGMWLSAAVLLPLGIFFTYKAVNDSDVFNKDVYLNYFRRFFGVNEVRHLELKEVVMEEVDSTLAVARLDELCHSIQGFLDTNPPRQSYTDYWLRGFDRSALNALREDMEQLVEHLSNSRSKIVINTLTELPVLRSLWIIRPCRDRRISLALIALFPIGVPLWLYGRYEQRLLRNSLTSVGIVAARLISLFNSENNNAQNG